MLIIANDPVVCVFVSLPAIGHVRRSVCVRAWSRTKHLSTW